MQRCGTACGRCCSPAIRPRLLLLAVLSITAPFACRLATADDPPDTPTWTPPVKWMLAPTPVPEAAAASEAEMKAYREIIPGTDAGFEMIPIPGGNFRLGSPPGEEGRSADEGPQVEVQLDPFWMGKHEVTWDQYELWAMGLFKQQRQVLGQESTAYDRLADAVTMPTKPYQDMSFGMGRERRPAICMTQLAAKMYCKWLSAKTGRYYRLPTEAEWEYACRAGSTTAYSFGDDPSALDDYAWYFDNSDDAYHAVGEKKPNAWGLHDMHGNVAEWVLDQYAEDAYAAWLPGPVKNPLRVPTTIYPRVVRGGSWIDDPDRLRSAARLASQLPWKVQDPQLPQSIWYFTNADFVGLRVVRPLTPPAVEDAVKYDLDEAQKEVMREYGAFKGAIQ